MSRHFCSRHPARRNRAKVDDMVGTSTTSTRHYHLISRAEEVIIHLVSSVLCKSIYVYGLLVYGTVVNS